MIRKHALCNTIRAKNALPAWGLETILRQCYTTGTRDTVDRDDPNVLKLYHIAAAALIKLQGRWSSSRSSTLVRIEL
jgi:hypothetical protein